MFQGEGNQRGVNKLEELKKMTRDLNLNAGIEDDVDDVVDEVDEVDDYRCSNWEVLNKLLSSHGDLTRMFLNLWEEERNN